MSAADRLLESTDIGPLLVELGVVSELVCLEVEPLDGGVSSMVFLARSSDRSVVVKQALPQLRTAARWLSDVSRFRIEVAAATALTELLPNKVPAVLAVDAKRHLFVMEAVPNVGTWKQEMLAGVIDQQIAADAGAMLGAVHTGSSTASQQRTTLEAEFASKKFFYELRIDPYLRTVMALYPDLASPISQLVNKLLSSEECLVHADFSPKNLLITPDRQLVLIDHEVAHLGDPTFDLAFCLALLSAKAIHLPESRAEVCDAMASFCSSYSDAGELASSTLARTPKLLGAMMLARVDGKSPAEYLTEAERLTMRELARTLVASPVANIAEHITILREMP